jgi:hypothetical protein
MATFVVTSQPRTLRAALARTSSAQKCGTEVAPDALLRGMLDVASVSASATGGAPRAVRPWCWAAYRSRRDRAVKSCDGFATITGRSIHGGSQMCHPSPSMLCMRGHIMRRTASIFVTLVGDPYNTLVSDARDRHGRPLGSRKAIVTIP